MIQQLEKTLVTAINQYAILQIDAVRFLVIVLGSIAIAKLFLLVFKNYLQRLTSQTETKLDDLILQIITRPLYLLIILGGFHLAFTTTKFAQAYLEWISKVFFIIYALIIAWVTSRLIGLFVVNWLQVEEKFEKTPRLITRIINITIYLIVFLIILAYFKIPISPIVATLGVGGLAVGLALQSTLSNFFAGLHIISDKPIQLGDYIELEDGKIAGFVEDIGWRSIRLRTLANNLIVIPNSVLAESIIKNRSAPSEEQSAVVEGGVSYDSNLEEVERILIDIAKEAIKENPEQAIQDFEPIVRFYQFGDSNIDFKLIVRATSLGGRAFLMHELIKKIKERFDREGIEISWPVRKVYFANQLETKQEKT